MLWAVSRAPHAKLQAYKRRMGWTFPWASSLGGNSNFDFNVSYTEEEEHSGDRAQLPARGGVSVARGSGGWRRGGGGRVRGHVRNRRGHVPSRRPGMSAFALEDAIATTPIPPMRAEWTASGDVPVARPRAQGAQRDGCLVAPRREYNKAERSRVVVALAARATATESEPTLSLRATSWS